PLGDRLAGRWAQVHSSPARYFARLRRLPGSGLAAGDGGRPGFGFSMLARPPVCPRASGMVLLAPRWHLEDGGKPAEALRRHRQLRFPRTFPRVALGRAQVGGAVLGGEGRADFSRRQSTHQTAALLDLADPASSK